MAQDPDRQSAAAPSGARLILWLFGALSVATLVILLIFANTVEAQFRPRIYTALAGNLMLPLLAVAVFAGMDARRRGEPRWWIYLLAAPIPLVNLAAGLVGLKRARAQDAAAAKADAQAKQ
ncbi:MAG: hypothetical protein ACPGQL_00640 [Thermoplasmatota archaeon]